MTFWSGIFTKAAAPMPHIALVFPAHFPTQSTTVPETEAHVTIMYLGTTDTVQFTPDDVRNALVDVPLNHMLWVTVTDKEMFGPDLNVPVLRVDHDMLHPVNASVTDALNKAGIQDPSIYADVYKPHITVSQETWDNPPAHALLNHAELWWGGTHLTLE